VKKRVQIFAFKFIALYRYHQERLTSKEAQDEPYFLPVKQAAEAGDK
jgi:hypothetical protein